jgi:hypothetical protein
VIDAYLGAHHDTDLGDMIEKKSVAERAVLVEEKEAELADE